MSFPSKRNSEQSDNPLFGVNSTTEQWINLSPTTSSIGTYEDSLPSSSLGDLESPSNLSNTRKTAKSHSHSNSPRTQSTNQNISTTSVNSDQFPLNNMSHKSQVQGKERVEQEKERIARKGQEVKSTLTPVKIYLLAYNGISTLLWGHLLYITLLFIFTPRSTVENITNSPSSFFGKFFPSSITSSSTLIPKPVQQLIQHLSGSYNFHGLGYKTKYIQSLAGLEIIHAALGWVRSPLGTVASQVFSRVWTVWAVVEGVPDVTHSSPLFTTMLFAWSLTEVIRYTFYFLSLLNISSPFLNYLRYTTFIPLYPIGASSEAFLSFSTLPSFTPYLGNLIANLPTKGRELLLKTTLGRNLLWSLAKSNVKKGVNTSGSQTWGVWEVARLGMFFIWWPSLYVLYTYMFKQRRKVLGKSKGKYVGGTNKAR